MYINQVDVLFDIVSQLVLSLPEDQLMSLVQSNPHTLAVMKNPPAKVIECAIRKEPELIEYVENPSKIVIEIAIQHNPELVQYIKEPSKELSLSLIKKDIVKFLPLIHNKDGELYKQVLELNPNNIKYIPKEFLPKESKKEVIQKNPESLSSIDESEQTEELCLEAVKLKGRVLRFVKRQTYEIIKAAIEQDVNSFKYLDVNVLSVTQLEEIRRLIKIKKIELEVDKKLGLLNKPIE